MTIKYHGTITEVYEVFHRSWYYCEGWWVTVTRFVAIIRFLWLPIVTIKIIREPP